jgi:hypothetical protein
MLIDEADAFMKGDEKLRGIINSGHRRRDAHYTISEPTRDGAIKPSSAKEKMSEPATMK